MMHGCMKAYVPISTRVKRMTVQTSTDRVLTIYVNLFFEEYCRKKWGWYAFLCPLLHNEDQSFSYLSGQDAEEDEDEHALEGVGDGEQVGGEGGLVEDVDHAERPGGPQHEQQRQGPAGARSDERHRRTVTSHLSYVTPALHYICVTSYITSALHHIMH